MDFQSFQKLRFFLAVIFPSLSRGPVAPEQAQAWLARHPRLHARWERMRDSKVVSQLHRANVAYAWFSYSADRFDWSKIPAECVAVLRWGVLGVALLCVLVPAAMRLPWPPLVQEVISGTAGEPVAGWSVGLWMAAAALGWGCLLVGTALAPRIAFLPTVPLFIYFTGAMTGALPRSWWNLALPLSGAAALLFFAIRSAAARPHGAGKDLAACVPGGLLTGASLLVTTPLARLFPGRAFAVGLAVGALLGLGLWWSARRIAHHIRSREPGPAWLRADVVVALLAVLHLGLTVSLATRGGLVVPAQGLYVLAVQVTGYFWPLFYFVGVGVVFKLLRQTMFLEQAARELVPARVFVPAALALLLLATGIVWSETLVATLGTASQLPVLVFARWLQRATAWIWARPLTALTLEQLRWVLPAVLVVGLWGAWRRRLDAGLAAALLFPTILLWFAVQEYFFEFAGFARSPLHTAASLLVFAIFGLWLAHGSLRPFLAGDSAAWPRPARVVMYCALLLFVLLPIHIRAAAHDATLSNEIYLYLFFGIVDLGLPYSLHLYAERRFLRPPLPTATLLGIFAIGAALAVPFTILDKLAVSGWSFGAVWSTATAQLAAALQGHVAPAIVSFPTAAWVGGRGFLAMGLILAVGLAVGRRMRPRELAPAATIFALVAVATGLACFGNRSLDLPLLPPQVGQLITPLTIAREIDVTLVARYLSFVLPAFGLGLALTGRWGRTGRAAVIGAAFAGHIAIATLWPAHEPWVRSSGVLGLAGLAGGVLLLLLVLAVRERLDAILPRRDPAAAPSPLLTRRELWAAGAVVLLLLGAMSAGRVHTTRAVPRILASAAASVNLPALWSAAPGSSLPPDFSRFTAPSSPFLPLELMVGLRPTTDVGLRNLLLAVGTEIAPQRPGFAPLRLEPWDQFRPGALALDFEWEVARNGITIPAMGTIVVAPLGPGWALVGTMVYSVSDRERRWDLARALQALPADDRPVLPH